MSRNLGKSNRIARAIGAVPLTMCAVAGPYPLALRVGAFAVPAFYLAATSVWGSCAFKALLRRISGERG